MLTVLGPALLAASIGTQPSSERREETETASLEPVVVVARKSAEPLAQVSSNVSLIDRQEIERGLALGMEELFRFAPGVSLEVEPHRFGTLGPSLRGLGGNRLRLEIDGVPLPEAFKVGAFAQATRELYDLSALSRVEILRGPASTLYGSDAIAGIVAFRTLDPGELLAGRRFGLESAVLWRGRDQARALSLRGVLGDEDEGLLLALAHREGRERANHPREARWRANPADERGQGLLLKWNRLLAGGGLSAVVERQRQERSALLRSLHHAPGRFATTHRLEGDDHAERDRLSAHLELLDRPLGLDRLSFLVYGQRARTLQDSRQWRQADRATPFPSLRERRFLLEQKDGGGELVGELRRDLLGAEHWLVAGISFSVSRFEGLRDGREINLASGAVSSVILGERLPVRDFPVSTARKLALFLQDEIAFGRLALVPGLRFERYRLGARPDEVFRDDFPTLPVVGRRSESLTPRLGARWSAGEDWHLFAQYSEGFRSPAFADVNIGLILPTFNYEVRPNPLLKPERSRGLDLGVRFAGEAFTGTVTGYRADYRDLIESRADLGVDPASGVRVFQSVNRERARVEGLEAELSLGLFVLSPRLERVRLRMAAAVGRGEDRLRRQPLNGIEPARAVIGLGYEGARFGGELVLTGVAGKRRIDESRGRQFAPPGYATIDLFGRWPLSERFELRAALFNLGDRRYWPWASVRGVAPDAPDLDFYTAAGRSLSVSLESRF